MEWKRTPSNSLWLLSNPKLKKPSKEYLKDVTYRYDEEDRVYREFGYVNFLKIPAKELLYVLANTQPKFNESITQKGYKSLYPYTKDEYWRYRYRHILGIDQDDLLNLIGEYVLKNYGTKKYETLAKILDIVCDLRYKDWRNMDRYNYESENFFGHQADIDHDFVSEYHIYIKNPIPLEVIRILNDDVKLFQFKDEKELDDEKIYIKEEELYCRTEIAKKILNIAQELKKENTEEMEFVL